MRTITKISFGLILGASLLLASTFTPPKWSLGSKLSSNLTVLMSR